MTYERNFRRIRPYIGFPHHRGRIRTHILITFKHKTDTIRLSNPLCYIRTEKLSEYQLIREILWMLRAPTESPVFELRNGEFVVTDLVALLSATDQAVKTMLNEVNY